MLKSHFHLWLANDFLENFLAVRLLLLKGHLGSGKTLLGMALAKWLFERGLVDGIFTNIPTDPGYIPILHHCRRAAVLLDEAWTVADPRLSSSQYKGYGAFARKLDSYWISPSKHGVDKRVADMVAKRKADIWAADVWLWGWEDTDSDDKGWFLLHNYQDLYDTFFSGAIPSDDGGILESLVEELREASGSTHLVYALDRSQWRGRK